jgi:membrane fusion protein (multidrug efflux system)
VQNPPRTLPGGEAVRELRSGRIVRVRLTRRVLTDVIMIPLQAVIPLDEEQAVYVVANGTAQRRVVELGFMKGWQVQVRRGLSAGDRLIVSGHRFVAPGQPVSEQPPTSQPAAAGGPDVPARPDKR